MIDVDEANRVDIAERKLHEFCPARDAGDKFCINGILHYREAGAPIQCPWEQHAAIRALRSVAFEAGLEAAANKASEWMRYYSKDKPGYHDVHYDLGGLTAAIRSLAAKENPPKPPRSKVCMDIYCMNDTEHPPHG